MKQMQKISYETYLQKLAKQEDIILLDVRRVEEYEIRHLPGATLFTLDKIEDHIEAYFPDKSQIFVIYCRSGIRSIYAIHIMQRLGYKKLYDLGGIISIP